MVLPCILEQRVRVHRISTLFPQYLKAQHTSSPWIGLDGSHSAARSSIASHSPTCQVPSLRVGTLLQATSVAQDGTSLPSCAQRYLYVLLIYLHSSSCTPVVRAFATFGLRRSRLRVGLHPAAASHSTLRLTRSLRFPMAWHSINRRRIPTSTLLLALDYPLAEVLRNIPHPIGTNLVRSCCGTCDRTLHE